MCEHAKKLILWMDGELGTNEAAEAERHLRECVECRECLAAYKQAGVTFEAYCDAVVHVAEDEVRAKLAEGSPRAEGAARQGFLSRLKPRPTKPSVERAAGPFAQKQAEAGGLDDNMKQKRARMAVGAMAAAAVIAMAAAAVIAMVLMIPRHRVAQTPAPPSEFLPASGGALHAVQRPAGDGASVQNNTADAAKRDGLTGEKAAIATDIAAEGGTAQRTVAQNAEPRAVVAKRKAPLAIATGAAHRRAAARPARVEEASGVAREAKNQIPGAEQTDEENAAAAETPIEIAVPTEGMFPPGAVPAGIGFTAVVTISADDGAQSAGLRPRFAKFPNGGKR